MNHNSYDLESPLLDFSNSTGSCKWKLSQAVLGTSILGANGSAKTTGSGEALATKFLNNGFGGLVLCAKHDEKDLWVNYCQKTNRLNDLIIVEPGGEYHFNFLEYESTSLIKGVSLTENISQVLKTVIRASEEKGSGKSDDSFWENSLDQLVVGVIDLCLLAYGGVTVKRMYDILTTVPTINSKMEEIPKVGSYAAAFEIAAKEISAKFDTFVNSLTQKFGSSNLTPERIEWLFLEEYPEAATLKMVDHFFIEQYRLLSEKTRSIITMSFSGLLFRLMREPVYSLFCRHKSNFRPEDCFDGKIILLNIPVKHYHKIGRDSQVMFKYIWQRAMERRNIAVNNRPVFLWADEAQNFLHEHDAEYQATARSSRIATVYISQNLSSYYANMGGSKSEHKVKSFLGTLGTKIFHANTDTETNRYASELIGEAYNREESTGTSVGEKIGFSYNESYKLAKLVRSDEFVKLKQGGTDNNLIVEAYMHCQNMAFPSGFHHHKVVFKQSKT